MLNKEKDILVHELCMLEAHLKNANNLAARLREKLQPVSTGRSKKNKGLSADQKSELFKSRTNRLLRTAKKAI